VSEAFIVVVTQRLGSEAAMFSGKRYSSWSQMLDFKNVVELNQAHRNNEMKKIICSGTNCISFSLLEETENQNSLANADISNE